ncbi:MAG TPA: DUF6624 domain-containing protein [Gemmataceae bacterium]|nr:DUF6624 domain-containing protein [Gemmataceae bacterium]
MVSSRRYHLAVCALVFAAFPHLGTCAQEKKETAALNEGLRKELLQRVKEDQDGRFAMIEMMKRAKIATTDEAKKANVAEAKRLEAIDRQNTARMKEIVAKHGWPGKSLVGVDGANAAWLLVQHADLDKPFQKRCLELMREAFKRKEVSGTDLAYLTDRVLVGQKEKQLYGTQFNQVDGKWVPAPIQDEANVDKRRKEVGMLSMAEYTKLLEEVYKPANKK